MSEEVDVAAVDKAQTPLGHAMSEIVDGLTRPLIEACRQPEWATDADIVKRARIGARRLREAFLFGSPWLHGKATKRLVNELSWLTRPLAEVRDLDVMADLVREVDPDVLGMRIAAERARAAEAAMARVTADRLQRFETDLERYRRGSFELQGPTLADAGSRRLLGRLQQVQRRAPDAVPADIEVVHDFRRALRRFRYDLETLLPWQPALGEVRKPVRKTLDHLGRLTDCTALLLWLGANGAARQGERFAIQVQRDLYALPTALEPLLAPDFEQSLRDALQDWDVPLAVEARPALPV